MRLTLFFFVSIKLFSYAALRFVYPFSQFLAKDWGLSVNQMSMVLGVTEFAALPAGFFAFVGDQIGPGLMAMLSFSSLVISCGLMLLPPLFSTLMLIRFGIGFALNAVMVAIQNYVSTQFPHEQLDKVTGLLELSYSLSALVIIPTMGLIYEAVSWRASFAGLTIVLGLHLPFLVYIVRQSHPHTHNGVMEMVTINKVYEQPTLFEDKTGLGARAGFSLRTGALAYNLSTLFLNLGANLIATEFGILLSEYYALSTGQSAGFFLLLALGELLGVLVTMSPLVGSSASFASLEVSNLLLVLSTLAFMFWGLRTLNLTVTILCAVFACAEFGSVIRFSRALSFCRPVDASAMLGSYVQFEFAGRTLGALLAADVYQRGGHSFLCFISLCAFMLVSVFLRLSMIQRTAFLATAEAGGYISVISSTPANVL